MKTSVVLFIITFQLYHHFTISQDLGDFQLMAHYSLIGTAEDLTGNHDTIELINAPFDGDEGVYSYGGYIYDANTTDSSLVRTPEMPSLFDSAFVLRVEFKLDTIVPGKPIIVAGDGWRYLGMRIANNSTIRAMVNNSHYQTNSEELQPGLWYTATIIHDMAGNGLSQFFLDEVMIFEKADTLVREEDDFNISNTNFGNGSAFQGWWRNLQVFGAKTTSGLNTLTPDIAVKVYPNPSCSFLSVEIEGGYPAFLVVLDQMGRTVETAFNTGLKTDISNLLDGLYFVKIRTNDGQLMTRKVLKRCQ